MDVKGKANRGQNKGRSNGGIDGKGNARKQN